MTEKTLNDLFLTTLKDVYYAEKAILRALPKMAKAADSKQLKEAFLKHRDETAGHVERLEQIFQILGKKASGKTCDAIKGIIEEGQEIMEDFEDSDALDAGLMTASHVAGDLAAVVAGRVAGRLTEREITIFDSTGTALEDVAAAALVFNRAAATDDCGSVELTA